MLKSIKITNFGSIGETQELSFKVLPKDVLDDSAVKISDMNVNLVNCIIGHNASGKTTVLKAISFLFFLIKDSYTEMKMDEPIPVLPHKLFSKELTKFEIEFFSKKTQFKYIVELNQKHIVYESLSQKTTARYSIIFKYTREGEKWDFKPSKIEINKNDLSRFEKKSNTTVFCSLIETGYLPELSFIKNFETNINSMGYVPRHPFYEILHISKNFRKDSSLRKKALNFTKDIDLSISNFDFSETSIMKTKTKDITEETQILECVHASNKKKFKLPLPHESHGTRHSLQLFSEIIPVLKTGGIVVIDEIESGLHPYVVQKVISLFENTKTNPHHAQLLFSTHQHILLNDRTKTQIFITEKENENLETEIFRLDEVEGVRNDDNYFHKYMAGTYGGIPDIKWVNV
jgi:uncharacterized protein